MSSTSTNMATLIEQAAADPARARDQAVEVQSRPLAELIEADKHLRKVSRAAAPFGAIKRAQVKPGRAGGLG